MIGDIFSSLLPINITLDLAQLIKSLLCHAQTLHTGTHKLDLMMIGKPKSPRCFKNMDLPVYYKSSKNAWQTYTLFSDWYNDIFIPSVTRHLESKNLPIKALLLVDNATCHGSENNFTGNLNFKVMFFPPK